MNLLFLTPNRGPKKICISDANLEEGLPGLVASRDQR